MIHSWSFIVLINDGMWLKSFFLKFLSQTWNVPFRYFIHYSTFLFHSCTKSYYIRRCAFVQFLALKWYFSNVFVFLNTFNLKSFFLQSHIASVVPTWSVATTHQQQFWICFWCNDELLVEVIWTEHDFFLIYFFNPNINWPWGPLRWILGRRICTGCCFKNSECFWWCYLSNLVVKMTE